MRLAGLDLPPMIRAAFKDCRRFFLPVALFSLLINILYLAPAIYMLQVYDRVVPTGGVATLLYVTLALAIALITMAALDAIRLRLMVRASLQLNAKLGPVLLRRTIAGGAPAGQAIRDFETVRTTVASPAAAALFDLPWFPLFIAVSFLLSFWIGILALVAAAGVVTLAFLNQRATRAAVDEAGRMMSNVNASTHAASMQAGTIRGLGMTGRMADRALALRATAVSTLAEAQFTGSRYTATSKFLRQFVQSLALGLGALLAIEGKMSSGGIIAASIVVGRALQPIDAVIGGWAALNSARAALARVATVLTGSSERPTPMQLPAPRGRITATQLALRSEDGRPILFGVSFEIAPGQCLAIIGPSGAGKSTLASLVVGSMVPTAGTVRIDGAQLSDWDPDQLGRHIGYVPQNPALFEGTVRDNISRFDDSIDQDSVDSAVFEAAQLAGVHELILRLPNGYNTQLGPLGGGFSAGQAQRIALARALYRNPPMLVLDEPNSNLDSEGDAALANAIMETRKRGGSVLLIAHRRGALAVADRTLVLESGRPKAIGPTAKILAQLSTPATSETVA